MHYKLLPAPTQLPVEFHTAERTDALLPHTPALRVWGQSLQVAKYMREFGPHLTKGGCTPKGKIVSVGRGSPLLRPFLTVPAKENRAKIQTPLAPAIPFDAFVKLGSGGSGRRHYQEPQCANL